MQNKPIVVIATGVMNAGGTESLIMETLRHASGRVRYVMLIHYDREIQEGIFDNEIKELGVEMRYIPSIGSVGVKGYLKGFRDFVESYGEKIDIVHSHLNASGGIISLAAKRCGIRHRICHCHADIHYTGSLKSRILSEVQLQMMRGLIDIYATDRWACSRAAWRRLYYPWRKSVIINNMIDTQRYFASEDKQTSIKKKYGLEGKFVVGSVGRVAPIKNYELILRAIKDTDAHFVCFGRFDTQNKYCSSLLKLAESLGVAERVHWMGNSNAVSDDIHCIDLFVMPSFTEGFGMAAIEAQAAGLPCLLSSGIPKVVDVNLGLAGFLDPNDPEAWHQAISEQTTKPSIPNSVILQHFITKEFDSPSVTKDIENKYLRICGDS